MEKTIKKLLLVAGVVVGGLVALTPLTSYAVTVPDAYFDCFQYGDAADAEVRCPDPISKQGNAVVNLNIETLIEMDVVSGDPIDAQSNMIASGEISATVRSSREYTISLSADQPSLTHDTNTSYTIPAANDLQAGTNGWGVKKDGEDGYTALTSSPQVFYEGLSSIDGRQTDLEIGVATSPSLPAGTYSTVVTVTATAKE